MLSNIFWVDLSILEASIESERGKKVEHNIFTTRGGTQQNFIREGFIYLYISRFKKLSGFQVTGMNEWEQKLKPNNIPMAWNKTQKTPWTKI